jgi:hypothetical protein
VRISHPPQMNDGYADTDGKKGPPPSLSSEFYEAEAKFLRYASIAKASVCFTLTLWESWCLLFFFSTDDYPRMSGRYYDELYKAGGLRGAQKCHRFAKESDLWR